MYKFVFVIVLIGVLWNNITLIIPKNYYEPRIGNMTDFVGGLGYPLQFHEVRTEDGYILGLHRIPYGRTTHKTDDERKPPVLLVHGLLLSSFDWVVLGPGKSMGLILADAGYDVWIGNTRGNIYSRRHAVLDPDMNKKEFFNFSYHEIGIFDLPAMIDYVLEQTGFDKLSYIGFSQGVTSVMVMGSLKPEYNEKIQLLHAFAPVTNAYNITSVIFNTLATFPKLLKFADMLGWYEMFDSSTGTFFRLACQFKPLCNMFFKIIGISHNQMADHDFQINTLSNFPAGMSLKQIIHYIQGTRTGIFAPLNSNTPYDLTRVTAPIVLYYGESDNLINNDILLREVMKQLPNATSFKVPYPKFDHMDFLWGKDIRLLTDETLKCIGRSLKNR